MADSGASLNLTNIVNSLQNLVTGLGAVNKAISSAFPSFVPVPATSTSAGTPYQVAVGGGYFYICVGTNSWVRIATSTF